jgi:CrcB protein
LRALVLVGMGGFVGSVLRYVMSGAAFRLTGIAVFPIGTFAVNVLGCLAIGFLSGLAETRDVIGPQTRIFLMVGLLGGFTTFSTFGFETFTLVRDAERLYALGNILASVAVGLCAVWLGQVLARV